MTHTDHALYLCDEKVLTSEFWDHQNRYPGLQNARYILITISEDQKEYILAGFNGADRAEFVYALQNANQDHLLTVDLTSCRIEHGPLAWKSIVSALDKSPAREK